MIQASANCFVLLIHCRPCAFALALPSAGRSIEARIAMMAITTNSSINVNAETRFGSFDVLATKAVFILLELLLSGVYRAAGALSCIWLPTDHRAAGLSLAASLVSL